MLENNNNKGKNYPLFSLFLFLKKKTVYLPISPHMCVYLC